MKKLIYRILFLFVLTIMMIPMMSYADDGNDSIVGLKIVTPPERMYYPINETIDSKGLKVAAVFESGNEATLSSGYTVSCDTSSLGKHNAIVSYTTGGNTYDASFEVIVDDKIIADGRDSDTNWPTDTTWTLDSEGTLTINGTGTIGATGDSGWYGQKCWTRLSGVSNADGLYSVHRIVFTEGMKGTSNFLFHYYKGLKEVQFPESFEFISGFTGSALETFNIPENITYVGAGTFSGTPWWESQSPGLVYKDGVLLGWKDFCPDNVVVKNGTRLIAGQAFENCTNIESIVIPDTVKKGQGGGILNGCTSLKTAVLPAEVSLSFSDCEAIEEVTYTGTGALTFAFNYARANSLKKVVFKDGVTGIGDQTFMGCPALEYVEIPSTVTSIGQWTFERCESLTIYTPKNSYAYNYAKENGIKVIAIEDKQAADRVAQILSELPDTISLSDVATVKEALSEYNLLTEDQKALISETFEEKLKKAVLDADQFEHFWESDYTIDVDATCTAEGSQSIHCSVCGIKDESTITIIPKKEHKWNTEYTVDKKATYAAVGSKSIHCSVCDAKKPNSAVSIAKLKVPTPTVSKPAALKKGLTVKWKKVSVATGYEIQYALNSKFTKSKKTVKITKAATVSKKITKLKAKKKYYIRIRAYKVVSGKTYYSAWCKTKTVTTKK